MGWWWLAAGCWLLLGPPLPSSCLLLLLLRPLLPRGPSPSLSAGRWRTMMAEPPGSPAGDQAQAGASGSCTDTIGRGIDTLIFDIDDTLYPIDCGFTGHRNGTVVQDFMVTHCGFRTRAEAKAVRDAYFARSHSTVKALITAAAEGGLPAGRDCLARAPTLGEYWAAHCDFGRYLSPEPALIEALGELRELGLKLVIFTNGPKAYGLRVLETLQLRQFFRDEHIFAVEDVLPACKPEAVAFEKVLRSVGSTAARTIMFEDSMKNIRGCKELGIGTVLLTGLGSGSGDASSKLDDVPQVGGSPSADATPPHPAPPSRLLCCLVSLRWCCVA
jgi:putative hydrolase of the HAD superfamily